MTADFFNGLKTDKVTHDIDDIDLAFENISPTRVKDSYDEIWNDFLEEDVQEALTHAVQEIDKARGLDNPAKYEHLKRATIDLGNYLKAANCLAQEFESKDFGYPIDYSESSEMWKRDAKRLVNLLASFCDYKIDELITDVILCRYCADDQTGDTLCFAPGYSELYKKIGDDALFKHGDVRRARLWYYLLTIDWNNLQEENDLEINNDELEVKLEISWWSDFLKCMNRISALSDDDMIHTQITDMDMSGVMSEVCNNNLQEYLSVWGNYGEGDEESKPEDIWNAAKSYIDSVKTEITESNTDKEYIRKLRYEVMMAWIIIDQAKYYYLISTAMRPFNEDFAGDEADIVTSMLMSGSLSVDRTRAVQHYFDKKCKEGYIGEKELTVKVFTLLRAITLCDRILYILNSDVNNGKVAYYTKQNTLLKMLPDTADSKNNVGKFAVMHVAYMNDPNEGIILNQWVYGTKYNEKNDEGRKKADYPFVFIKCFTTRIDDLPMWEMYGDHAKGCCIVVDMQRIMNKDQIKFPVYNVCYIKKKSDDTYEIDEVDNSAITSEGIGKIRQAIQELGEVRKFAEDDALYQDTLNKILSRVIYLFKNADYSYECEKRIIVSLSSGLDKRIKHTDTAKDGDMPMLYVLSDMHVYIDEIILGPKYEDSPWKIPYLQESLEKMCKEIGTDDLVRISYSAIEYR